MQVSRHLARFRIIPLAQFRNQLKQPCQTIRALKARSSLSSQICSLLHDVFCGETLPQCFASSRNKRGVRKRPDQANEKPMPVHRRMPVVATKEGRRQFPWWGRVCIAIQGVANVIGILFVDARECKSGEAFSRVDIELTCTLGGRTHGEKDEDSA